MSKNYLWFYSSKVMSAFLFLSLILFQKKQEQLKPDPMYMYNYLWIPMADFILLSNLYVEVKILISIIPNQN